jgi:hypothetical protein
MYGEDILSRHGVPEHLINLIHLHCPAAHGRDCVGFSVGKVEAEISSAVGVKHQLIWAAWTEWTRTQDSGDSVGVGGRTEANSEFE